MVHHVKHRYAAAALLAALALSCSKKQASEESETPADQGGLGDDRVCQTNAECGEGFTCAFDHSRSRAVRYCIQE